MKKKIEIELEIPDMINEDLITLLSKLDSMQLQRIKGIAIGMLLADPNNSFEEFQQFLNP